MSIRARIRQEAVLAIIPSEATAAARRESGEMAAERADRQRRAIATTLQRRYLA